jgi:hypothetical protein
MFAQLIEGEETMNAVKRKPQTARKQQQLARRPVPPPPADDEWTNTSDNCQDDDIQAIFNNSKGKEKEVNFRIVNRGQCPVRVAVTETRNSGAIPDLSQKIPPNTKERVNITVPAGHFIQVVCSGTRAHSCDWTISDLKC